MSVYTLLLFSTAPPLMTLRSIDAEINIVQGIADTDPLLPDCLNSELPEAHE